MREGAVKKLSGMIRLTRPLNSSMMGIAVIIGEAIAIRGLPSQTPSVLGFTTAFTLTAASMVVNDYYDRAVDAVNEPDRPIPSGVVSTREALALAALLSVSGLVAAGLTSIPCLSLAAISLITSMGYNTKGKEAGLVGNFMVSGCVAIPFVYGGLVAMSVGEGFKASLLIFAIMAFLSNTGREVTKGVVDVEGDRVRGVRTISILFGPRGAALVASAFYLSAVGMSAVPWLYGMVSMAYLPFVLVADAGFILSSCLLLNNYSRENARRVKGLVLVWMGLGLVAFVTGGI